MSGALIAVIVIGGCLVVFGAIAGLLIVLNRMNKAADEGVLKRLHEEAPKRGWTYEEHNDSYISVYNANRDHYKQPLIQQPTRQNPLGPLQPYHMAPKAVAAKDIITGVHRGRPFIAATFTVNYASKQEPERVIWVRTPAPGPALSLFRVTGAESRASSAIGQGDLQLGVPEFDDKFRVSEQDEGFARAVLNPAVIQYLLNSPRKFQSMGLLADHIDFADRVTDHRDPEQLIPALDLRCDVLDRIPQTVWAK
jgi:hypothetical protein